MRRIGVFGVLALGAVAMASDGPALSGQSPTLAVASETSGYQLGLSGAEPFRVTPNVVSDERLVAVPGTSVVVALWNETSPSGDVSPFYAISRDGETFSRPRDTSYMIRMRYSNFDPLKTQPIIPDALAARDFNEMFLVQFISQPITEYREIIQDLGGTIYKFVNHHAYIMRLTPDVREAVEALPFVRWVGPYHPAYKLEETVIAQINAGNLSQEVLKYSIMVYERGGVQHDFVADQIRGLGGDVIGTIPLGFRVEANLSVDQVHALSFVDEVQWMDARIAEAQPDMDVVREIGGANYLELIAGFTGEGVRGEAADTGVYMNHPDWKQPPIIHRQNGPDAGHGTSVYGIIFGTGENNAAARGLLPDGVGIFMDAAPLRGLPNDRHEATAELVDPNGPYRAVFQTNSTGDNRTRQYTSISADMDDILFVNDIAICQSMSNANRTPDVRPQAWAKNMLSVGGITHRNTLNRGDDISSGSSGPAEDGRIKPELAHFYDSVLSASNGGGYSQFSGTSAATPITCGHVGLFFQMWHNGIFGNPVDPDGDVFDNRSHMTTAKAMLVNTAFQYPLNQGGLGRINQGWGMADLKALFESRDKMLIIDETDVLDEQRSSSVHPVLVEQGTERLAATLVYADPAGVPGSNMHRINDLSLHVVSPSGVEYWGNNGLMNSHTSTPGGSSNVLDTVENVFVANPEPGQWSVEVIADEINEDSHVETQKIDADYALVVSGVLGADPEPGACCFGDGGCEDLLPEACVTQGGRFNFGRECGSFQCPIAGACCVNNNDCEQLLKSECDRRQGAVFIGEGISCERACVCDQLKKLKAKCKGGGTIKAIAKYRDDRFDGEPNTFRIGDRIRIDVNVSGRKATLFTCCFDGEVEVTLEVPEGCASPVRVNCD